MKRCSILSSERARINAELLEQQVNECFGHRTAIEPVWRQGEHVHLIASPVWPWLDQRVGASDFVENKLGHHGKAGQRKEQLDNHGPLIAIHKAL